MEREPSEDVKTVLLRKYRHGFLDRLTVRELEELRSLARRQVGKDHRIDPEHRRDLEVRLRQYFPEDVLRREIASIESLLTQLDPSDLKTVNG